MLVFYDIIHVRNPKAVFDRRIQDSGFRIQDDCVRLADWLNYLVFYLHFLRLNPS